jgi:hypothetical protein
MSSPANSPFQFLDAFDREDAALYFGREREVGELYEMTYQSRLIVFFGASGTGKTSLVQCGLANRFPRTRWQELRVRRDGNINASIRSAINERLQERGLPAEDDPLAGLEVLYEQSLQPIFLTIDQLEELFILDPDEAEKADFFRFLQDFLDAPLSANIILVMREEFIARLWDWEYLVPSLFDFRYRIRHPEQQDIKRIIAQTLQQLERQQRLQAPEAETTANRIYEKLKGQEVGTELTYIQVFLDQLYKRAPKRPGLPPRIEPKLVAQMEGDVFDQLLEDELKSLEKELGPGYENVPLYVLAAFVSDERTKRIRGVDSLEEIRQKHQLSQAQLNMLLQRFENMRLLKRYES